MELAMLLGPMGPELFGCILLGLAMMAIMLPDAGAGQMLTKIFAASNVTLHLFVNDVTPAEDMTEEDYTYASGGGYAYKTLTPGNWSLQQDTNGLMFMEYTAQSWVFTGQLTNHAIIYGYVVLNVNGVILFADRFAESFQPENLGDTKTLTPRFALSKGTPT